MRYQCLDEKWTFRRGLLDSLAILQSDPGETVNLPHDGMIGTPVTPDAPAEADMGYFTGDLTNYTKYVRIPEEWRLCRAEDRWCHDECCCGNQWI